MAELEQIYAELPEIECQGLCSASCNAIVMSAAERQRIRERGVDIAPLDMPCPALSQFNRCTVYDARPLICRLYGLVEQMACPWGCRPQGGFVDDATAHWMLRRVEKIGGKPDLRGHGPDPHAG
ncbi:YkgJ family cysteine cluster protein [Micromonospora sp. RV43]|uniref:YkgJ family cysteine cluster protein n=1 Tax=Micromonospora sp. RV43 TaxID=1661387 RepID=UPI00069CEA3D|nr:YkgJ family cysteine cluster protein [Micromonospora sp. RV43]